MDERKVTDADGSSLAAKVDALSAVMAKRKLTKISISDPGRGIIFGTIMLEMSPLGFDIPTGTGLVGESAKDAMPTDEDMLEWSTGGPLPSEVEAAMRAPE